ncbi:MAG: hypothetical protein ACJZ9G_09355 [Rhodospirillales bacterium]|tara:strand:- start:146 stop:655 length:510 start_codon:yes stop_codon:yes gene_type:complete
MNMVSKIFKKDEKETPALILELSFAGQMSIWGLRLLASGYRAEIDMTKALIDGFRRCNAVQAGSNLLFLSEIIFSGLTRNIQINCSCNPGLSKDEKALVSILNICQKSPNTEIKEYLTDFITHDAANNAVFLFINYTSCLRDAGLMLTDQDYLIPRIMESETQISSMLH